MISIFENSSTVDHVTRFLDISARVSTQGNEEGLLGLAFHPAYASNGYFFVYYSAANPRRSVLSRFTVSANPEIADPVSETIILEVPQPFSNHNGGSLVFGPDGYLYLGLGDGGSGGDPQGHGQNPTTLLGSIIRIDVDTTSNTKKYGIPAGNPFATSPDGPNDPRPEIWAYGLRNPWRFSFDRTSGDLWVGDVGQNAWEEVNVVESGGNYGWNILEGKHCFEPSSNCNPTGTILPITEYSHSGGNCSVTGGHVSRSSAIPELTGVYLYADYCSGRIWGLRTNDLAGFCQNSVSGQNS
ncbi:MAG: PQQ-dependent sugar dehydrogenase, partial [Chloroflexi bacterium]|nr:PQQ-dependent sugar dehydrogenase [Chloroflexota bacterium]